MPISIHAPLTGSDQLYVPFTLFGVISIHAPLTGSDAAGLHRHAVVAISIHAPLTGSDCHIAVLALLFGDFNPRSPYGERLVIHSKKGVLKIFQSTLPLRGATSGNEHDFYLWPISIHAPLTGSDFPAHLILSSASDFNPRSPYGERRSCGQTWPHPSFISIHAPLTGSDNPEISGFPGN